ncbi:MAG: hypothetical protein WCE52_15490 [Candidatus Acidiferrum sp.]
MRIARYSSLARPTLWVPKRFLKIANRMKMPLTSVAFRCATLILVGFALISTENLYGQALQEPFVDPLEPVTGKTEVLTSPEQRQPAIDLLTQVQRNFSVVMSGAPYTMKVSFTASGTSEFEGEGTMDALEDSPNWYWTAHLAGVSPMRMAAQGHIYGNTDAVPMRVQMVRGALFRPVPGFPNQKAIRTATANISGLEVTCVLLSGSVAKAMPARGWWDREYCVDANGLLRLASEAAGAYMLYDYENAIRFHGHVIPRNIKVVQGGTTVLEIRVESLEDRAATQETAFNPTPEMLALGPAYAVGSSEWTPIRVDPNPSGPLQRIDTVIVHAIASHDTGKVLDAEAVQTGNPALAAKAIDVVRQTSFPPTGLQRELFVAVEFFNRQE